MQPGVPVSRDVGLGETGGVHGQGPDLPARMGSGHTC